MNARRDEYKSSRIYYIIASTAEYFISILVGTAYLAKLAGSIGLDDGTVGIVTSFLSLGCGFQVIALFIRPGIRVKRLVVIMNLLNQLCFTLLYAVPLFDLPTGVKSVIFIFLLLSGHILMNVVFSPKVVWSRSLVDDDKRGRFSASCETASLISGMIFTLGMGALIDGLEAQGRLTLAFMISGIVLFVLTVSNAVFLLLMKEKRTAAVNDGASALSRIRLALTDRATLTLMPLYVLWNIALYITFPFFGTYQIEELGFSMTLISVLSVAYAIVRSLVSRPLGALGDKSSFVNMLTVSYIAEFVGLLIMSLGGRVSYVIYYMLYAVAIAGTNSGKLNLIYDYVPPQKRTGAVAILYTVGGFVGFFATMAARPLVDHIQASGNRFLFLENVYAQQVLSVLGVPAVVLCLLYANLVVRRLPKQSKLFLNHDGRQIKLESKNGE